MHCQTCGKTISSEYQFCPYCGYAVDRFSYSQETKKIEPIKHSSNTHSNPATNQVEEDSTETFLNVIAIILIFVQFPVGLLFMWITKSFSKKARWTITLVLLIASVLGLLLVILWTASPGYIM